MIMGRSRSCRPSHLILSGHQTNTVVGRGGVVSVVSSFGNCLVSSLTKYFFVLN